MTLQAARIRLNQMDSSFVATTNVRTVTRNSKDRVLVTAGSAEGVADRITYVRNVQLWSGNTEIKSDHLIASRADNSLHAKGQVRSNLDTVRAVSDELDYSNEQRIAHYKGNVRAQKEDLTLQTQDMTVKVDDRAVSEILARGGVVLVQGDRRGTGEQAIYDARKETVTLIGKDASVTDPERGTIRGARLVMNMATDGVVVESEAGSKVESRHPVKK
jgi:lipopolysaccharide transport protein LptA